jgi:class 3 adenylate cyclase
MQLASELAATRLTLGPAAPFPFLWRFTIPFGLALGFGLGLGLGAVSGDYLYYVAKEVLLGALAAVTAPLCVPLLRRALPDTLGGQHVLRRYLGYFGAGGCAGLLVMGASFLFPLKRPLFDAANLLYPFGVAGLMPLLGFIADAVYVERIDSARARAEKERTRMIFGQYVSEAIAQRILDASATLPLEGETRQATVLIADIRGFTRMLQERGAEEVVRTLNDYFTRMIDVIARFDGTVNKFIGDAIIVLYNAPLAQPDANPRALQTARAMQAAVQDLNTTRVANHLPPIHIGIAIDTGSVVCGNIGSPKRLEYTAIGTPVNTAYQLASLVPAESIYLTENVRRALDGNIKAVFARRLELKGDTGSLDVFTLLE